jgi:hypothetical protein
MVQRVYLDLPTEGGPVLRIRGSEGDWRVLLWPARFHQALANWYQGDREAAKLIAEEISAPPPDLPPVPSEYRQRLSTFSVPAPDSGSRSRYVSLLLAPPSRRSARRPVPPQRPN